MRHAGTPKVIFHRLDIASRDSVDDFAQWAKAELGQVDLLINNAGEAAPPFLSWISHPCEVGAAHNHKGGKQTHSREA